MQIVLESPNTMYSKILKVSVKHVHIVSLCAYIVVIRSYRHRQTYMLHLVAVFLDQLLASRGHRSKTRGMHFHRHRPRSVQRAQRTRLSGKIKADENENTLKISARLNNIERRLR